VISTGAGPEGRKKRVLRHDPCGTAPRPCCAGSTTPDSRPGPPHADRVPPDDHGLGAGDPPPRCCPCAAALALLPLLAGAARPDSMAAADAGGPVSRRASDHPVGSTRYCCATALAGLGITSASPCSVGRSAWPWGWWVGCSAHAASGEPGLGAGLGSPAPSGGLLRLRASDPPNCLGGCCCCQLPGLKTGRGGAGHRPIPYAPLGAGW